MGIVWNLLWELYGIVRCFSQVFSFRNHRRFEGALKPGQSKPGEGRNAEGRHWEPGIPCPNMEHQRETVETICGGANTQICLIMFLQFDTYYTCGCGSKNKVTDQEPNHIGDPYP